MPIIIDLIESVLLAILRIIDNPLMAFIFTIILEFIIYAIFIRKNISWLLLYALLINLFTWPLANLFYDLIGLFWLIEFFVFLTEFILIMLLLNVRWKKAIIISFVANLMTSIIGILLSF